MLRRFSLDQFGRSKRFRVWTSLNHVRENLITMIFEMYAFLISFLTNEQRLAKVDEKVCIHKVAEAHWNERIQKMDIGV
jgi:hypothetical protein